MAKHFLKILILLSVLLIFIKCAQVVPLSGGPRDETAPELKEAIPAAGSVNFTVSTITLKFNEFIIVKDLKNQLIVSPALKTDPEISAEGKNLKIVLKDELLPNTTYRLFFGKAIADITEGNPVQNFEYVFSTGPYIDSLKLGGKVAEAFSRHNLGEVTVGLYLNSGSHTDSLPFKNAPDYFCRSDNDGNYEFTHLPPKTFKVIAYTDKNKNLRYDGESEKIGFRDENLSLVSDTSIHLLLFSEKASRAFIKKSISPYYGKAHILYNTPAVFKVSTRIKEQAGLVYETSQGLEKDTVTIYYKDISDTLGLLIHNLTYKKTDTIDLALPKIRLNKPKSLNVMTNIKNGVLPYPYPFRLSFHNIIDTLRTDIHKIQLTATKDSVTTSEVLAGKFVTPFILEVDNKMQNGINYKVSSDTACIFDVNGRYNDSLNINFKLQSKTEFGKVTLKLLLNKKQAYIVQLTGDKEQVVKERDFSLSLSSSNATSIDFNDVLPGTYGVKILFDNNENKKWDTGNYLEKTQPEKVFISSKQIKVLPDWEVEEEILVK